jgi:galactokinase
MADIAAVLGRLKSGQADLALAPLYGDEPAMRARQVQRYCQALESFRSLYPAQADVELFSSPGRTEVGGNHTDHNAGRILAAAVDLDIVAVVAKNSLNVVRVTSEGYSQDLIALDQLLPRDDERYTSAALARGVCARLKALGHQAGGFDAYMTSSIPKGSGLSSSAAYEVLVAVIENDLYNASRLDQTLLAQVSQFAENQFFGKPCGLMDQSTCATGGVVTIDFKDFANPVVRKLNVDFRASGFAAVIVDTGGDHADLNDDYTALEHEMKAVAAALGGQVLREFSAAAVLANLAFLRTKVSDRAVLRALHFYGDDQRVVDQVGALEAGDYNEFLRLVTESGHSSWMLCQNCYSRNDIDRQGIAVALALSESLLRGRGAWRVHGGGFAGTILAFVPRPLLDKYIGELNAVFGLDACHELAIRPVGATRLAVP